MILGIDASNIRAGGGVTHLVELLRAANPQEYGFSKVIVWSIKSTLDRMDDRTWLVKLCPPMLTMGAFFRISWQVFRLTINAHKEKCDLLFIPGGSFFGSFPKIVSMSQNLLPFEWKELKRNGFSFTCFRYLLLRFFQSRSFENANGVIFLTEYAKNAVSKVIKRCKGKAITIPHGIDNRFVQAPKCQYPITHYSFENPFSIIYVSTVNLYKHQWHVAKAIELLHSQNLPVRLILIGASVKKSIIRLEKAISKIDQNQKLIHYLGPIPYDKIASHYNKADLFLFASSCENMPIILLEGMASGLPVACSNRGPMPEILGDSGIYFDPEDPNDIAKSLTILIDSPNLRTRLSQKSFQKSKLFTWKRCANDTFEFISKMAK